MNPRQGLAFALALTLAPLVLTPPGSATTLNPQDWPASAGQSSLTANNHGNLRTGPPEAAGDPVAQIYRTPTRTATPYRGAFPIPIATAQPVRSGAVPPLSPIQPVLPTLTPSVTGFAPPPPAPPGPGLPDALSALVPAAPGSAPGVTGSSQAPEPVTDDSPHAGAVAAEAAESAPAPGDDTSAPEVPASTSVPAPTGSSESEVVAAPAPAVVRGAVPRRRVFRGAGSYLAGTPAAPGFCVHLFYVDKQPVLDAVTGAGFGWVKQQVPWAAIENAPGAYDWTEFDEVVDAVTAADLGLVVSVNRAPSFYRSAGDDGPPDDPATLRRFMEAVASRYAGRVQAYEVWNEANLAVEWGYGRLDAGAFVRLLQAGYDGVKAGDAGALVIAGALTPTGVNDWQLAADDVDFLRAMYAYDGGAVRRAFDALGAHPSGFNNPPDDEPGRSTRPAGEDRFKGHWSFYFRRVEQLRQVMVENGDGDKQIWLTEFGWASSGNPAPGYEYAVDISEEDQAAYLVRAYQRAREQYPWIGTMAVWNLNFQTLVPEQDEKWAFGLIRPDFTPRPAYSALAAMPK